MGQAKQGDNVKVHYTGKFLDGKIFDSSKERAPLEFKIGEKKVIPGFELAIIGMQPGELKTVTLNSNDAYGPHLEELVTDVDRGHFPEHITPEVGQQLEVQSEEGFQAIVTITNISGDTVTLDANHPLAGKDLVFDIELVEIA